MVINVITDYIKRKWKSVNGLSRWLPIIANKTVMVGKLAITMTLHKMNSTYAWLKRSLGEPHASPKYSPANIYSLVKYSFSKLNAIILNIEAKSGNSSAIMQDAFFLIDLLSVFFSLCISAFLFEADFPNYSSEFLAKNMIVFTLICEAMFILFRSYKSEKDLTNTRVFFKNFLLKFITPIMVSGCVYFPFMLLLSKFEQFSLFMPALNVLLCSALLSAPRVAFRYIITQASLQPPSQRVRLPQRVKLVQEELLPAKKTSRQNNEQTAPQLGDVQFFPTLRGEKQAGPQLAFSGKLDDTLHSKRSKALPHREGQPSLAHINETSPTTKSANVLIVGVFDDIDAYLKEHALYEHFHPIAILTPQKLDFGRYINETPVVGTIDFIDECLSDDTFQCVAVIGESLPLKTRKMVAKKSKDKGVFSVALTFKDQAEKKLLDNYV
ncbi:MAG: hypothetical protein LBQ43_04900 [Holosporales bacterium]|jgi:hypothetical protein|nr:hypothetical protein [Holosporales bacterium]